MYITDFGVFKSSKVTVVTNYLHERSTARLPLRWEHRHPVKPAQPFLETAKTYLLYDLNHMCTVRPGFV